eukprot:UN30105
MVSNAKKRWLNKDIQEIGTDKCGRIGSFIEDGFWFHVKFKDGSEGNVKYPIDKRKWTQSNGRRVSSHPGEKRFSTKRMVIPERDTRDTLGRKVKNGTVLEVVNPDVVVVGEFGFVPVMGDDGYRGFLKVDNLELSSDQPPLKYLVFLDVLS